MASHRRVGGIRKHQRRDRDGDLVMGTAPRVSPATRHPPRSQQSASHGSNYTELRITGWTDEKEIPRLIQFLERHSSRRSPNPSKGGVPPIMVKRSKVVGNVLTISVRPDDVIAFSKINGFSFASAHGNQKLNIAGTGIRSRSPNHTTVSAAKPQTSETIDLFKAFLERRYDANLKLLNLSSLATDEEVAKSGMFETESRQSKFFPVLMTICDRQMKNAEAKRDAIHSVTLSNNGLPNLGVVKELAITLPEIKNLDLSSNKFTSTKDLSAWKHKFRGLEHLILTDNPLETSQPGWEQDIIKWFPRLRLLNGVQVRTEAQIARLDMPKQTPPPCQNGLWLDGDKIAENFLVEFFQGFDNDRNALIQKYYDSTSTFTMNVNAKARGGVVQHNRTPWDAYLPQSRNLKFITGRRSRFFRKQRGPDQIQTAWAQIPPTRHAGLDTNKYSMDCQPQPGLPDPSGQYSGVTGLMVTVHGEYEEHRTARGANEIVQRAFDRTFMLGPGGLSGVRVVSDMLCLRAAGGHAAWIPQGPTEVPVPIAAPAATLTPEQEAMVVHVCTATNLKREVAIQCLQAGNWNLEAAAQLFTAQKDTLPPDAFN
ncbi:NTF2-like protein [Melanomma pulvis-pyrius CBS 109.77]|uniref:mRNA export factor MEX67 n=1 Tax=Melanomma pulvis-pyrius CBS 109.77 TaxID=1314802 RepID=A0A6A6WQR2_9PLEO|nr:NTF2-like protein [Melanomma pulvis-pyrius CBS 109.77]